MIAFTEPNNLTRVRNFKNINKKKRVLGWFSSQKSYQFKLIALKWC